MNQVGIAAIRCLIVLSGLGLASGRVLAQQRAPVDSSASMAKPPAAASGRGQMKNPDNPDNMPVKRPNRPTNDRMMHKPPASAAIAK